jgi:hypothetical protein
MLHPVWFTKFARAKGEAQLPGWDRNFRERFLNLYRAVNIGITVFGLVLLGWLFNHMRSPDWDVGPVTLLLRGYIVVQDIAVRSRLFDRSVGQKECAHALAAGG